MSHLDENDPLYRLHNCPWYVGIAIVIGCALAIGVSLYVCIPKW